MKQTIPVMWIGLPNNTLACACSSIQWNGYSRLPATGYRDSSAGAGIGRGSNGKYWSGEIDGAKASSFYFYTSSTGVGPNGRSDGFPVRCVQEFTKVVY